MTEAAFFKRFEYWKEELKKNGFPISNNIKEVKIGWSKNSAGKCILHRMNYKPLYYRISISKYTLGFKKVSDIDNVIVHELLHTVPNGMSHKGQWAMFANKANKMFGLHITVYVPKELETPVPPVKYKYFIKCECCGKTYKYQKIGAAYKSVLNNEHRFRCCACHSFNLKTV